jgi:flagellar biosynthetic protein FlhB
VAAAVAVAGGGWNFTFKPLQPKFAMLNPLSGVARLFSKQQLIDALKAVVLALLLFTIGGLYLRAHLGDFAALLGMSLPAAAGNAAQIVLGGLLLLVLVLAVFAAVDLPLQRHLLAEKLKMSHQEAKQEHKESEGNQEVKGKQKARMREMTKRRMLAAVPKADLVVMNPTHYAVALKYEDGKMAAPRVVAKGADLLALRIRDVAKGAQVPVLQAPVLARALYAHTKLDAEIPAALFAAVAQVLAYVYRLRAALAGQGADPGELPELPVPAELDPHQKAVPDMEVFE